MSSSTTAWPTQPPNSPAPSESSAAPTPADTPALSDTPEPSDTPDWSPRGSGGTWAGVRALIEEAWRHAWRRRALFAACLFGVVGLVAASVAGGHRQPAGPVEAVDQSSAWVIAEVPPVAVPAGGNRGLVVVGPAPGATTSDLYLVDPGGTAPTRLTSTPSLDEYAPTWSPDGTRLAFIRADPAPRYPDPGAASCLTTCDLVVVDLASDRQQSLPIAHPQPGPGPESLVPVAVKWAPDGRSVAIPLAWCGMGGCGGSGSIGSIIVDVASGRSIETRSGFQVFGWSPDGRWLAMGGPLDGRGRSVLFLLPAEDLDAAASPSLPAREDLLVISQIAATPNFTVIDWSPDGSSVLIAEKSSGDGPIDVVSVPSGHRRTVVRDGTAPLVSPDGRRVAYHTDFDDDQPYGSVATDLWVASLDGTGAHPVAQNARAASWSPDGQQIVALDERGWFTIRPDGSHRTGLAVPTLQIGLPLGRGSGAWQHPPATQ